MRTPPAPLAVVTGASSGIGFELARAFAERGYDLVVAAEDDGVERAAERLRAGGRGVEAVRVELAAPDGVDVLWARVEATGRAADAVAINAGVAVGGAFAETALDAELQLIALNVTSAVRLAKRAVRAMVARGSGRILITSSIAAAGPGPYMAVYSASKAFLLSFAEAVRHELRDTGVTVTALEPGATETPIFARGGMADTLIGAGPKTSAAEVARAGVEGLIAGEAHVVAGSLVERLQVAVSGVMPDAVKAAVAGKLAEPGSAAG